jgi:perosamine synthetase
VPLDTLIFNASACGYPKPRVSLLPVGFDGLSFSSGQRWASAGHFRHFSRGRYALREAYRLAGIGPGSTLLAPAYHCRTMLDPALALGGEVLLYPLHTDLSPNLSALDALADTAIAPISVLLLTHFFGIPQDVEPLAAWCSQRGIVLVEDASHAFFTETHRQPRIGWHGDFVTSSSYKFLPSADGGLLYARDATTLNDVCPRATGLPDELRGIVRSLSKFKQYRRPASADFSPASIDHALAILARASLDQGRFEQSRTDLSTDYHREDEGLAGLRSSRWIARHADAAEITRRRRTNYQRWAVATRGLAHCYPLRPELPDDCIPYMFPLVLERPSPHFAILKKLGVPSYRWDSIVASNCTTALDYRLRLLHLPCHQSLNDRELDWMIAAVQKVGAGGTAGNR